MATKIHGKNGVLYLSPGTGEAVAVASQVEWSLSLERTLADASDKDTDWNTNLEGLKAWSGSLTARYDEATQTVEDAALASGTSKIYLYENSSTTSRYWYGDCWPDFSISSPKDGVTDISGNFTGDDELGRKTT